MARIIENKAQITVDNNPMGETCPVVTRIESGLKVQKYATSDNGRIYNTGIVGKSRKVTYDILLSNYSSVDFTNVKIVDNIVTDPSIDSNKITYIREQSMFDNDGTLPEIIINVGTILAESQALVHYTLQFDKSVPINTKISNTANITYDQNTAVDEEGNEVPVKTNTINITIFYTDTTIKATKKGPDKVLCSENFDYVLTFENTGDNEAVNISIEEVLPDGFVINSIVIKNGEIALNRGTDYLCAEDDRPLKITSIGNALNIAKGSKLVITINGKFPCG